MKEQIAIHGVVTVRARYWTAPSWAKIIPKRFWRYLKRFGSYSEWQVLVKEKANLLTNGGRDFIHNQAYTNTAAGTRGANFVGVSSDAGAPAAGDTSLTGEITTGGFARKVADTITHTAGTNTSQFITTWTATGAQTDVQKAGTFNQAGPPVAGTLVHENTFAKGSFAINDQLQLTWTFTLG